MSHASSQRTAAPRDTSLRSASLRIAPQRNDYEARRDGLAQCARLMDRAIKTLRVIPEPGRIRQLKGSWPDIVRDPIEAYGWTAARPPRFRPEPRDVTLMLPVLQWLTWLENEGGDKRGARVIVARGFDLPWWLIASRFGRDPRTAQRWYGGGVTKIYIKFQAEVAKLS